MKVWRFLTLQVKKHENFDKFLKYFKNKKKRFPPYWRFQFNIPYLPDTIFFFFFYKFFTTLNSPFINFLLLNTQKKTLFFFFFLTFTASMYRLIQKKLCTKIFFPYLFHSYMKNRYKKIKPFSWKNFRRLTIFYLKNSKMKNQQNILSYFHFPL